MERLFQAHIAPDHKEILCVSLRVIGFFPAIEVGAIGKEYLIVDQVDFGFGQILLAVRYGGTGARQYVGQRNGHALERVVSRAGFIFLVAGSESHRNY